MEFHHGFGGVIERTGFLAGNLLRLQLTGRAQLRADLLALDGDGSLIGRGVLLTDHSNETALEDRHREIDLLLTLRGDRHAGDTDIHCSGHQSRNNGVKPHRLNGNVVTRLLAGSVDQIDLIAHELLRLDINEFKGREGRFGTDAESRSRKGGSGIKGSHDGGTDRKFFQHKLSPLSLRFFRESETFYV